jgi:O-antigen/teichoic acid export membrane protein
VVGLLSRRRNLLYGVLDQGVFSLVNLGLNIAVAATSSSETFGALGLVLALYLLETGLVYGGIVEPYSVSAPAEGGDATRHAVAASVVLGLVLGAVHLVAAVVASGMLAAFLLAYALATPGLLVQSSARGLLVAGGKTRLAFRSNLVWAVVQVGLSIAALAAGSSVGVFVAWAAGGWASAACCLWCLRARPRVVGWRSWFRGRTKVAASWAGDYLAQHGLSQVMVFTLGAVAGLTAVSSYRGALQLTGPATVVVGGLRQVILPGAARRARAGDGSLERAITGAAVAFPAVTLVLVAPFLLLPSDAGAAMLGESWDGARAVLPWILVMRMANTAVTALSVGLRATHDYRATLVLRVAGGVSMLVGATVAGAWWGAMGASVALAIVAVILVPLWRVAFVRQAEQVGPDATVRDSGVAGRALSGP